MLHLNTTLLQERDLVYLLSSFWLPSECIGSVYRKTKCRTQAKSPAEVAFGRTLLTH
jgi:hypothetical protein